MNERDRDGQGGERTQERRAAMGIAAKYQRRTQDDMRHATFRQRRVGAELGGEKGAVAAGAAARGGDLDNADRRLVLGGGIERQHRRFLCCGYIVGKAVLQRASAVDDDVMRLDQRPPGVGIAHPCEVGGNP
ncbi:hypothetical protein D3C87_1740630 [compost metagenome]